MITSLTKQHLAFVLDIKAEEARAKMCVAWCKFKGIENQAETNKKGKVIDPYPDTMDVSVLSKYLNLPTLAAMIEDIETGYLNRPAAKKWILCDYPEKKLLAAKEAGRPNKLSLPAGLKSMLPTKTQQEIKLEWQKRFNCRV